VFASRGDNRRIAQTAVAMIAPQNSPIIRIISTKPPKPQPHASCHICANTSVSSFRGPPREERASAGPFIGSPVSASSPGPGPSRNRRRTAILRSEPDYDVRSAGRRSRLWFVSPTLVRPLYPFNSRWQARVLGSPRPPEVLDVLTRRGRWSRLRR
jgi:hypothetical protein